jgi:hypothetical protein
MRTTGNKPLIAVVGEPRLVGALRRDDDAREHEEGNGSKDRCTQIAARERQPAPIESLRALAFLRSGR